MRWKYLEKDDSRGIATRDRVQRAIEQWWTEFAAKRRSLEDLFARRANWDLPSWMKTSLGGVDSRLMWEYGPAVLDHGHRLVITPESNMQLRPMTASMLELAPRIDGWEFYPHRLAESPEDVCAGVQARTGLDLSLATVAVSEGHGNSIDLTFAGSWLSGVPDESAMNAVFILTENLLGEDRLDNWIGALNLQRDAREVSGHLSLDRVPAAVDRVAKSILAKRPATPCSEWAESATYAMYQLKPEKVDDFGARDDLFVISSPIPGFLEATMSGRPFFSGRFSNIGETFAYLKIDGAQGIAGCKYEDRSSIEDGLDEVLRRAGVGCAFAGGTGLRYSYVDIALVDVDRAVEVLREFLRDGAFPERTWMLFHDAYLSGEWVGKNANVPSPPFLR